MVLAKRSSQERTRTMVRSRHAGFARLAPLSMFTKSGLFHDDFVLQPVPIKSREHDGNDGVSTSKKRKSGKASAMVPNLCEVELVRASGKSIRKSSPWRVE